MSRRENRRDDSYLSDEPESSSSPEDGPEITGQQQVRAPLNDAAKAAVIRQINGSLTALLIYMAELRNHSHAFTAVRDDQNYLKQVVENAFQQIGRVCDLVKQIEDDDEGIAAGSPVQASPSRGAHGAAVTAALFSVAPGQRPLTKREREVLSLISEGYSNKQGALRMGISPRTFESHRAEAMRKLGARNTADLVRKALRLQDAT
ncbi:MAG TPA: helix-turn-helix transcriptional regulator [Bradyrhizobium sp.]|nr:helix-turn-helix transcriptional regulator [Bradyrhizobium sp.]